MANSNAIDEIFISLGLDPKDLQAGLQNVASTLEKATQVVKNFADGVQQGMNEGEYSVERVKNVTKDTITAMQDAAEQAKITGEAIHDSADNGGKGIDKLLIKTKNIGRRVGASAKMLVTRMVAPLAGLMAIGGFVGGYFSNLSTLDELMKKGNLTLEERKKKQELLATHSEKDLELFNDTKRSLRELGKSLTAAALPIVRMLVPAFNMFSKALVWIINLIHDHKTFFTVFFVGIAAIILKAVVPALIAMATAAWAAIAPFLPIIAIIATVAFWAAELWDTFQGKDTLLTRIGNLLFFPLKRALPQIKELKDAIVGFFYTSEGEAKVFFKYFLSAFDNAVKVFKSLFGIVKSAWNGDFEGIKQNFYALWDNIIDYFKNIFSGVLTFFTDKIKAILSKIPKRLLPDAAIEWIEQNDNVVKNTAAGIAQASHAPLRASAAISPTLARSSINTNTSETNYNGDTNYYIQSTEPKQAAQEIAKQNRKIANMGNKGVVGR